MRRHRASRGPGRATQRVELVLLVEERLLPPPPRQLLVLEIVREAARVPVAPVPVDAEVAGVQVDDHRADPIEEDPVVTGHHDDSRQPGQERLQVVDRLLVEVVGRLVEDHAVGSAHDQRRERQPAALAAGELVDAPVAPDVTEAETCAGQLGSPVGVPGVVVLGPVEGSGVVVRGAAVIGVVQPRGHRLQASYAVVERRQREVEHVADGGIDREVRVLAEEPDVLGQRHRPGVGGLLAGDEAQQRRLPDAVLADQAHRLSGMSEKIDTVEHDAVAVRLADVGGTQRRERRRTEERNGRHRELRKYGGRLVGRSRARVEVDVS